MCDQPHKAVNTGVQTAWCQLRLGLPSDEWGNLSLLRASGLSWLRARTVTCAYSHGHADQSFKWLTPHGLSSQMWHRQWLPRLWQGDRCYPVPNWLGGERIQWLHHLKGVGLTDSECLAMRVSWECLFVEDSMYPDIKETAAVEQKI